MGSTSRDHRAHNPAGPGPQLQASSANLPNLSGPVAAHGSSILKKKNFFWYQCCCLFSIKCFPFLWSSKLFPQIDLRKEHFEGGMTSLLISFWSHMGFIFSKRKRNSVYFSWLPFLQKKKKKTKKKCRNIYFFSFRISRRYLSINTVLAFLFNLPNTLK